MDTEWEEACYWRSANRFPKRAVEKFVPSSRNLKRRTMGRMSNNDSSLRVSIEEPKQQWSKQLEQSLFPGNLSANFKNVDSRYLKP